MGDQGLMALFSLNGASSFTVNVTLLSYIHLYHVLINIFQYVFIITGFLPRDTAKHHREHVLDILRQALEQANIQPHDIDVVCYTKGK